jgi:CRP-like cAMP-binding protein
VTELLREAFHETSQLKKNAHRAVTAELAEFRSAGNAKELRVELSVLKGLAGLSPEQFGLLAEQLRVRSFRKRALVYSANPAVDMIHIMLSGISRLTAINRRNERVLLEVLGPGDVICIPTLLPDVRHSLECEAFTECQVGVLSAQALVETVGPAVQPVSLSH